MNLRHIFSSPQFTGRLLLYLITGIIVLTGIAVITYQVLGIINQQQSIIDFKQQLQKPAFEEDGQSQVLKGKRKADVNKQQQDLNESLPKINSDFNPFEPLWKEEEKISSIRQEEETITEKEARSNLSAVKRKKPELKLVGVLINPEIRSAIIEFKDGQNEAVTEGDVIGEWKVTKITSNKIILANNRQIAFTLGGGDN